MRIVSFLPAGTAILLALGAGDQIVGISHENLAIGAVGHLPVVSHLVFEDQELNAQQIDTLVADSYSRGQSLYRVDHAQLRALHPDLLITQEICDVCAVTPNDFQRALGQLDPMPHVLSLNAHTLAEAEDDIRRTAEVAGRDAAGAALLADWERRKAALRERLGPTFTRPGVACLEWPDPLYDCGHWVPEMVALAGGEELLGTPGGASRRMEWERLQACQPDIVVMMFCGLPLKRAWTEARALAAQPGFDRLPAARSRRVWVVDGPRCFSQSGPGLMDGIEILAKLIHPERFGGCAETDALPLVG